MSSYHETESLITEISNRPTIWDCTIDDYRNKMKKKDEWVEVCRAVNSQYDEQRDTQKEQILLDLQSRWKSIKDSNNRSQKKLKVRGKSGSKSSASKKYLFADQLAFLQKANTNKETDDRLEMYSQDESFPQDQEDEKETLTISLSQTPSPGSDSSSHMKTKTSRKRTIMPEDRMITFMNTYDEEKDADRDFFNSMLPSVSKLTEDQKLMFRSEVISALQRVKSGGLGPPSYQPTGTSMPHSCHPRMMTPTTSPHSQRSSSANSDYVIFRPSSNPSHSPLKSDNGNY